MMVSLGLQGQLLTMGSFRGYGAPTECRHLTKSPFPRVFNTFFPTLVMILMLAATYAESVSSMPILERADPTGPILNGITNIVLPFIQPGNRMLSSVSRSSGDIQFPKVPVMPFLTTGMVSRMFSVEMKVRLSTRATSFGSVLANQHLGKHSHQLSIFGRGLIMPSLCKMYNNISFSLSDPSQMWIVSGLHNLTLSCT